ncbi:MAG: transposase, partial [Prevotellaceae bacterium]|nr:transposase [Prevotellaceae bacterium]
MKKLIIGIDVSKEKLDLSLRSGGATVSEWTVNNSTPAICKSLKAVLRQQGEDAGALLICAEYTGQYTFPLCCACEALRIDLWLENPAQIKYCSGVQRGKNDRIAACRIAAYAARYQDKARLFNLPEKNISTLKQLLSERDMYVSDRSKYQGQLTDQKRFMDGKDYAQKSGRLKRLMEGLDTVIAGIDEKIWALIEGDAVLKRQYELLCSIDGVGERTAVKMIVETNGFRDFDNARKFCCHAGVAPFKYDSGSSVRSRCRVSQRADKSIKALLHMAALIVSTR